MNNTQKALELLNVPEEFGKYNGQVKQKISRYAVIEETNDFTSGKLVKTVRTYVGSTVQNFGVYAFNLLSNYINAYDFEPQADGTLFKPYSEKTVTAGPYIGKTYWFGSTVADFQEQVNGASFDVHDCPYNNADITGNPTNFANAPTLSGKVYKVQISKTKDATGAIKVYTGAKKVVSMKRQEFEALTGWSYEEFAANCRTSFVISYVSPDTHITSMALDIEVSGNQIKGVPYINGVKHTDIPNLGSLITSYGKPWPSFIFDWRIYNEAGINAVGSSVSVRFQANEDNTVTVVAGNDDAYDAATRTLMYNAPLETLAKIVAYIECLPAQGKDENVGRVFYPETGIEVNW